MAVSVIDDIDRDIRCALRQFRHVPGFAVAAILCLALGIGATTTIYGVVDMVLLQPLPFRDSDRLVRVVEHVPPSAPGRPPMQRGIPYPDFLEWSERARTLSDGIAVVGIGQRLVRTQEGAAGLWGAAELGEVSVQDALDKLTPIKPALLQSTRSFDGNGILHVAGRSRAPDRDRGSGVYAVFSEPSPVVPEPTLGTFGLAALAAFLRRRRRSQE